MAPLVCKENADNVVNLVLEDQQELLVPSVVPEHLVNVVSEENLEQEENLDKLDKLVDQVQTLIILEIINTGFPWVLKTLKSP